MYVQNNSFKPNECKLIKSFKKSVLIKANLANTVKPELTATCLQMPPF